MHPVRISCVKCSTLYELDERLIPPAGAPVQCTRCGYVFTAKPEAAPAPRAATQMFGLAPPEPKPSAPRAATQMFGAIAHPAAGREKSIPAPAPSPSDGAFAAPARTQLFGKPAPRQDVAAPASPHVGTQIFGEGAPGTVAGAPNSPATKIFGASPATRSAPVSAPAPSPTPQSSAARAASSNATQNEAAREPGAARRGTQIFGAPASARLTAPQAPQRYGTQPFGAVRPETGDPARSGTLPFAGTPAPTGASAPTPTRSKTPVFGVEATPVTRASGEGRDSRSAVALPPDQAQEGRARNQRRRATVDLPEAQPLFESEFQTDPEAEVRAQLQRRNRIALAVVLAVLVGIPGFFGIRAVLKRRAAIPAEVITAEENALSLLRRDDRRSRKQALHEIELVAQKYPTVERARAIQLLALTLELDDVKVALKHLQAQSDEQNRTIARLQDRKTPNDWESRIEASRAQLFALKKQGDPLVEEASTLDKRVNGAFSALVSMGKDLRSEDDASAIRAQAVYYGVKGSDKVVALSERYRLSGGKDSWDAIALAEYAVNAHVAPTTIAEARNFMERIRSADSAFLRSYVLGARLAMAQKDFEAAGTLLEAVVALNPAHDVARELTAWADAAKHSEPQKAPPPEIPGK